METPNYYAIIPANVRYDTDLAPNAKLLYGEITALCGKYGYCFATNEYFAKLYSLSIRTITELLKKLEDKNYINSAINTKRYENGTIKKERKISINHIEIQQQNHIEDLCENHIEENFLYNNKQNNNINNTSLKVSTDVYKEIIYYMNTINEHDNFEIKIPFFYKYTSKDTQSHINARIRDGYDIEDFKDVIYWGYFKFVENQFQTETEGTSVKYFRPSTLFSDKHFGEYLNEYRARTSK